MKTVYTDRALVDIAVAMEWYEEQRKKRTGSSLLYNI